MGGNFSTALLQKSNAAENPGQRLGPKESGASLGGFDQWNTGPLASKPKASDGVVPWQSRTGGSKDSEIMYFPTGAEVGSTPLIS